MKIAGAAEDGHGVHRADADPQQHTRKRAGGTLDAAGGLAAQRPPRVDQRALGVWPVRPVIELETLAAWRGRGEPLDGARCRGLAVWNDDSQRSAGGNRVRREKQDRAWQGAIMTSPLPRAQEARRTDYDGGRCRESCS